MNASAGTAWWTSWWACLVYLVILTVTLLAALYYERKKRRYDYRLRLKQLEADRLKEIDHTRMKFFANISQEFRTPLTLILGHLDDLLQKEWPAKEKRKLSRVLQSSKKLYYLISQLLDLSQLDTGEMKLQLSEQNIIPFLKNITSSYENLAAKKNINLIFNAFYYGLTVPFDRDKLEKIMGNLLSNAIKFTQNGGAVTVLTRMATQLPETDKSMGKPPYVEIIIQDSGTGILREDLEHIFDRFYQVDGTYNGHQGSGVGLSLARDLIELHHGIIRVESAVGLGTTFTIWLPCDGTIYSDEEFIRKIGTSASGLSSEFEFSPMQDLVHDQVEMQALNNQDQQISTNEDQKLILIVDNNRDIREYIAEHLEAGGYRATHASDGESGLRQARELIPDLIISDVMLPNLDGFLFCQMLRQEERTSHIPLIMLTAKSSLESRIEGLESGADAYISKPFSSKELLVRVENLIKIRTRIREQFHPNVSITSSERLPESMDQKFLSKVLASIEAHIEDEAYTVEQLSQDIGMSVNHLNRKLKALLDQTAGHYIRTIKLKRGAALLLKNAATVSEIAYKLGFNDPANFTRSFKREFGCSPVQYQEKEGKRRMPNEE
jgi:signal transduction histidine kinase/AraC-like DNA-binding protein